jgi:hypothetical protein
VKLLHDKVSEAELPNTACIYAKCRKSKLCMLVTE